jgi:nicotinate-nucleotide pyrophosphorylase (carboxylating)
MMDFVICRQAPAQPIRPKKEMHKEFQQTTWDEAARQQWQALLQLAVREDLAEAGDWTTNALVPADAPGRAAVVARQAGAVAGLSAVEMTLAAISPRLQWSPRAADGQPVQPGEVLGLIEGPARGLLSAERLLLNMLGRLSGIATLTRQYVEAVAGTRTRIYDTRKTTPGWRRLEKYAVRCGGGWNHRTGLFEAVLIKDNHLALGAQSADASARYTPAEAVALARRFLAQHAGAQAAAMIVEVEVDTLEQLFEVLPAAPDLVLLDNMRPEQLRQAVLYRDAHHAAVELEASGGVNLATVHCIAETGVDRISVGALTHSAVGLDIALDWLADD